MASATTLSFYWTIGFIVTIRAAPKTSWESLPLMKSRPPTESTCDKVCDDLLNDDMEPVCMMYSRYRKGYLFFVNLCHARRAICKENMFLNVVHPDRCMISNQYFLPIF